MQKIQSFVVAVRKSRASHISHPTQQGYSDSSWEQEYEKYAPHNSEDMALFKAGLWTSRKLTEIRTLFDELQAPPIPYPKLLQLYSAYINWKYFVAELGMKSALTGTKNEVLISKLIQNELPLGPNGQNISPVDYIGSLVSAARFGLNQTLENSKQLSTKQIIDLSSVDGEMLINYFDRAFNLGLLYDDFVHIWHDCLWNSWIIEENEKHEIVRFPRNDRFKSYFLSEFRNSNLLMELGDKSMRILGSKPPIEHFPSQAINIILGNIHLITKKSKKNHVIPPIFTIVEIAAEEFYWNELLTEPLPDTNGLTIRELLLIYRAINAISNELKAIMSKDFNVNSLSHLLRFSPTISRISLVNNLKIFTSLPTEKIRQAINVLSYQGGLKDEMWYKPLIPINAQDIALLIPVLDTPNLIRTIEYWMKLFKLDLDKRGYLYEDHFIERISEYASGSSVFKKCLIDSGKIKIGKNSEEIDFILIFRNTILIGEIKCSIYPVSPIEKNNYYNIIEGAAEQAKRKSEFFRQNLDYIKERYKSKQTFDDNRPVNIIPLVISNLHLGVGVPQLGVPVVDLFLLNNYFIGSQKFLVKTPGQGDVRAYETYYYYSNEEEAENNIENYLCNLPYFKILSKFIDVNYKPLGFIREGEKGVLVESPVITI